MNQPPILPPDKRAKVQAPSKTAPSSSNLDSLLNNKVALLCMLFFVTGVLGVPLLWISKKFSLVERIFWSITNTLYTAGLAWGVFQICMWSWRRITGS
jgi:hypothetical protein